MDSPFQGIINKSVYDESGRQFIQVKHENHIYKVFTAQTREELEELKQVDDQYFSGNQQISYQQLERIKTYGKNLIYRDESGKAVAVAQILFQSIPKQEVRRYEAYSYGTAGRGYGQIMFKAQEVIAREQNKHRIRATVRVENTETIRAMLKAGYRIVEYDPSRYGSLQEGGSRLVMEKDLINESFPFKPKRKSRLVWEKEILLLETLAQARSSISRHNLPPRVAVRIYNEDKIYEASHQIIEEILQYDYLGVGLLLPEEYEAPPGPEKLLIFYRKDSPPKADRLSMPVQVNSEYGTLREVIVSFTPENAQIREEYAINDVAKQNVNNIDPISFKDEYNLFIGTMVDQGVKIVHSNSIGSEGKSAIFTRDPAYTMGNTFVIGRLAMAQRVYETEGMRQVSSGHPTLELTDEDGAFTEGGDIIFIGPNTLAVGLGQRTTEAGLIKLRHAFPDYEFIPVIHDDLHLDVLFTMVGPKKCLLDPTRVSGEFIDYLRKNDYTIIEADPAEQPSLGCNVVAIGPNKVIAVKENVKTNQRLKDNGVTVVEVSMPNVVKWGGGPRCITCPTHRELIG